MATSLSFLYSLHAYYPSLPNLTVTRFSPSKTQCCSTSSSQSIHLEENLQEGSLEDSKKKKKTKRKPKPGFLDVTMQKWSVKVPSQRDSLPWQESSSFSDILKDFGISLDYGDSPEDECGLSVVESLSTGDTVSPRSISLKFPADARGSPDQVAESMKTSREREYMEGTHNLKGKGEKTVVGNIVEKLKEMGTAERGGFLKMDSSGRDNAAPGVLPWKKMEHGKRISKTELAESAVPEHVLQRLRNLSLRMKERIKVEDGGVTQAVVDLIHEKWKDSEVVKIKIEGPPAFNMKRTHQILERKTGGLVIWRSGSSVALYRGMSYELPCVQSYNEHSQISHLVDSATNCNGSLPGESINGKENSTTRCTKAINASSANGFGTSSSKLRDEENIDSILDELGPRFRDWSGCHPLPVDADLLPCTIPSYSPPFRVLPYKMKYCLGNKEMTSLRRLARTISPHFALGRNRQLQGLAMAMVKLWEKSAIAKIAIKRGVQNTCNEIMAEEIKKLTGGTLVSRNKEYIVFYRGNDFLPPAVAERLVEREKLAVLQYEKEEQERLRASALTVSNVPTPKRPYLAGTLAESLEANSRWGREPSAEEREKMMKDTAFAKHASLVTYLERKLAIARGKVTKAERALRKMQEDLIPAELPDDQEIITDEERSMFRKLGLSMQAFLNLGRRGLFDGIVENIHLHWKHREIIKIMVKGKSLPLVKHIAISLEAESGGILISVDKTTKGYAIILYRGKNYMRPSKIRPTNLLTRRKALAHSVELQRREALNHHILDLQKRIKLFKSELDKMRAGEETDIEQLYAKFDAESSSEDDSEDEDEAYLETRDSCDEGEKKNKSVAEMELK
ncbi:CRM-domain containing factor [Nymphaea thermarum]|nr:CRM-domain containing factor [Nymphaea thermarum]